MNAVFHLDVIRRALDLLALAAGERAAGVSGFAEAEEALAFEEAREALDRLSAFLPAPVQDVRTSA